MPPYKLSTKRLDLYGLSGIDFRITLVPVSGSTRVLPPMGITGTDGVLDVVPPGEPVVVPPGYPFVPVVPVGPLPGQAPELGRE